MTGRSGGLATRLPARHVVAWLGAAVRSVLVAVRYMAGGRDLVVPGDRLSAISSGIELDSARALCEMTGSAWAMRTRSHGPLLVMARRCS